MILTDWLLCTAYFFTGVSLVCFWLYCREMKRWEKDHERDEDAIS